MRKTPFFIKLRPDLLETLRQVSRERDVTITSLIEDSVDAHLTNVSQVAAPDEATDV